MNKGLFILTAAAVLMLLSCKESNIEKRELKETICGDKHVKVLIIDSCEYIYADQGYASWGSHKGNCKFCAERAKRTTPSASNFKP